MSLQPMLLVEVIIHKRLRDKMNRLIFLFSSAVVTLFFLGCGPKMMIPPNVDLRKYQSVGFIDFVCDNEGNLDDCVSERFLETLSGYQKDAHIIKLGNQEEVLNSVAAIQMDEKAIQAIGRKYNVSTIITGTVHVVEVKGIVELQPDLRTESGGIRPGTKRTDSGGIQAEGKRLKAIAKISISARLCETEHGTTLWTASESGQEEVKEVFMLPDGKVLFDASDYRFAYRDLVRPIIKTISTDFKIRKKRM